MKRITPLNRNTNNKRQKTEGREAEGRKQKTENRKQRAERQKTEGREAENRGQITEQSKSGFGNATSVASKHRVMLLELFV